LGITQLEQKPTKNTDRVANKTLSLKGHLFKLGLVESPGCDRCKQAFQTASHLLCDVEALATLRFRHLGQNFMKPGALEDISVSRILHFVQGAGLLNELA
jgi:hypothetical protein